MPSLLLISNISCICCVYLQDVRENGYLHGKTDQENQGARWRCGEAKSRSSRENGGDRKAEECHRCVCSDVLVENANPISMAPLTPESIVLLRHIITRECFNAFLNGVYKGLVCSPK